MGDLWVVGVGNVSAFGEDHMRQHCIRHCWYLRKCVEAKFLILSGISEADRFAHNSIANEHASDLTTSNQNVNWQCQIMRWALAAPEIADNLGFVIVVWGHIPQKRFGMAQIKHNILVSHPVLCGLRLCNIYRV